MAGLIIAGRTEVVVDRGLPRTVLPRRPERSRVAILAQPASAELALEIARALAKDGISPEVIEVPDRDEAKTLAVATAIYENLARFGLSREDTVVGVGGGAVTDLAGFIAGTWLRGVEAVYVPTTLLGAIDASIGGKTGVNLAGKNLIGVFWHPARVLIDLDVMESLSPTLLREGLSEAIKAGLVGDEALFALLERRGLEAPIEEVISRAIAVKATIVNEDERERGSRAFLNFGHTLGHAIEFASALSHGEAVALGMSAAVAVSEAKVGFAHGGRVRNALLRIGLPVTVEGLDRARVRDLLEHDKKRDRSGLRMALLEDLALPALVPVTEADIDLGLAAIGL